MNEKRAALCFLVIAATALATGQAPVDMRYPARDVGVDTESGEVQCDVAGATDRDALARLRARWLGTMQGLGDCPYPL